MKRYIAALFFLFISIQAYAEQPIIVDGHVFTNVNCFQKNRTVTISGRVSGGNIRGRMTIRVHIYDEDGNAFENNAIIENYDGRGHLFETQVWPRYKARQWNVGMIEVWGNRSSQVIQEQKKQDIAYLERRPEIRKENNFKFFQPNTSKNKEEKSVIFSAIENVQIIVRDKKTNNPVLMKNINPHDFREVNIKPGSYTAKIIGKYATREQDFQVKENGQMIDLR